MKDGSIKLGEIHVNRAHYRNFENNNVNFIKSMFSLFWMNRLIHKLKKLDAFIVLTKNDKEKWPELSNVRVIPNPLPFYPEINSECTANKVIVVGRYSYEKGFDLLLQAWEKVNRKHPNWELSIYGAGDKDNYQDLANQLEIDSSVHLHEAVPNIIEKYMESSIFVLSSRFEGFGMVIAESMACGLPVVSFDCLYGPKEIISDQIDGLLAENGNIQELADKLCYLIEHPTKRKEMGEQAKKNIRRFKTEIVMEEWKKLFEELLKKKENK